MIIVKIKEIAKNFGIENAYQLEKFTGLPPSQAAYLWKADWKSANLKTLNTLCNAFKCTPNDLLEFHQDKDE